MNKLSEFLTTPVNVKRLVKSLAIEEDQIEDAAMENPRLIWEAGRYRIMKMVRTQQAVFSYERAYAEKRLKGRSRKAESGKREFTEGAVSDYALVSPQIGDLKREMDKAYADEEIAKLLLECFKQRRDMIKAIATIRASEISAELRQVRENMKKDEFEKTRKRVREQIDSTMEDDE